MSDAMYFNGRFTTTDERILGVEDRGFQFGDAVYEVFKFLNRRPVFVLEHFRRMCRGLSEIEIACPWDEKSFLRTTKELLERTSFEEGIVYVQVTRGEAPRAHFYPDKITPTAVAYSRQFKFPDATKKERGIRIISTKDLRWLHCDVKSVNLLANALAKKTAQRANAEEALLVADGFVREGASSNFFGVRGGRIITHQLDEHILPGIVRDKVVGFALAAKIRVDERPLREAELFDLDEAFVTSTTQGVMPVTDIDGRAVGNGKRGEVTTSLQRSLDAAERADVS